mgnify:CR=1 FL=1
MNKVYACSDLHGRLDLWEKISAYCDESDKIYFLGDAIDRGSDGVKLMYKLLADKRVTYLKGNHEDMFVEFGTDLIEIPHHSVSLWYQNGGASTIDAFEKLSFEAKESLIRKINVLPYTAEYINKNGLKIYMNHSGYIQSKDVVLSKEQEYHNILWSRKHFHIPVEEGSIMVHGHTPVEYMSRLCKEVPSDIYKIFKYDNNTKIDLDLSSAFTDIVALLDLDTLEPVYFSTLIEGETYVE